ncbi:MAG TPA: hypothetical protein VK988_02990 [Acidimicrobiales bacterium]|nr:hypothetical protein [Acidimicrobiales bacterium]
MGKASNRKKGRAQQRRDRPHLLKKLREQLDVLRALGESFDAGNAVIGYPLSTTIRVLVHDTAKSHALLGQTGDLSSMAFLDTSLPINPRNLLSQGGLVVLQMTAGLGATWVPRFAVPSPPVPGADPRLVPFGTWWTEDVMKDHNGTLWSRARMVLAIANKEGGAHIDPTQPVDVRAIEEENSMGWSYHDPLVGDQPMSLGPLMPSTRQIAHELEKSITRHFASEMDP